MEVVTPTPNGSPPNFDFNSARVSPYLSAPSSPKRFGQYYNLSAPTSPSRFYSDLDSRYNEGGDDGFAFSVSGESEKPSRSAEELFDGGKIKPLLNEEDLSESAKSPLLSGPQPKRSSAIAQGKKAIREAFAPRKKKEEDLSEERRGRDRSVGSSNSGRRVTRSLSPYRTSHYIWEEEANQSQSNNGEDSLSSISKCSRKWSLKDFLLFRSASEGRGSSKDPLRKFPSFYRRPGEPKSSIPGPSPSPNPSPRRKEPLSAHELHYARKKAESEDLKKRTFLPYKQGILGALAGFRSR